MKNKKDNIVNIDLNNAQNAFYFAHVFCTRCSTEEPKGTRENQIKALGCLSLSCITDLKIRNKIPRNLPVECNQCFNNGQKFCHIASTIQGEFNITNGKLQNTTNNSSPSK